MVLYFLKLYFILFKRIILDRVVSTAGGFISSVTSSPSDDKTKDSQKVSPTASVSEKDSESSIPSTSSTSTPTAEVEIPPTEDVEGSEGAEVIEDLDVDDGRKDLESNLQNKSAELEEDLNVAAAEGEDKGSEGDGSTSTFSHTASGEGVLEGLESDDPNHPGNSMRKCINYI